MADELFPRGFIATKKLSTKQKFLFCCWKVVFLSKQIQIKTQSNTQTQASRLFSKERNCDLKIYLLNQPKLPNNNHYQRHDI